MYGIQSYCVYQTEVFKPFGTHNMYKHLYAAKLEKVGERSPCRCCEVWDNAMHRISRFVAAQRRCIIWTRIWYRLLRLESYKEYAWSSRLLRRFSSSTKTLLLRIRTHIPAPITFFLLPFIALNISPIANAARALNWQMITTHFIITPHSLFSDPSSPLRFTTHLTIRYSSFSLPLLRVDVPTTLRKPSTPHFITYQICP